MPRTATTGRVSRAPIGFNSLLCNGNSPTSAVSGGNLGISGSSAFSFAAWGYLSSVTGTQTLVALGDAAGSNTGVIIQSFSNAWQVLIQGTGVVPASVSIQQNQFYEVVVTYAGGSAPINIFVNGLAINGSGAVTMNLTNTTVKMGRNYSSANPLFGALSDVRVWNVALTANQIATMYATRVVPTTGLVRRYLLNEGTGSSIADSSVTNDTGTVTNALWSKNNAPYGLSIPAVATPNQIASCLFYFEADQGVTLDGSNKVSQWNDLSGNGSHFTQSTAGLRPGYTLSSINGLPSVNLVAGSGNVMNATTTLFAAQPHTLVVVAKSSSTQPLAHSGIVALGSGGAGGNTTSIGTDNARKIWFGGAGDGTPAYFVPVTGTTYLLIKTCDGRTTSGFINNVSQGSVKQLVAFIPSPLTAALFGQYSTGTDSGNWNVVSVAAFLKELTPAEMNALSNYYNTKYALGLSIGSRTATSGRTLIT